MLDNFTDEQLQEELERRQKIKEEIKKPKQLETLDLEPLRKLCQGCIDCLARDGYVSEDYDHYVYETAMETVFGKNVWEWVNSRL